MFCPKCGQSLKDGSSFCKACGAPLPSTAPGAQTPGTAAPVAGALNVSTVAQAPSAGSVGTVAPPQKRRFRRGLAITAAAAVVILVVVVAVVYNIFFAPYSIDEKLFPDPVMRGAIIAQVDPDRDGKISRDEVKTITTLTIDGANRIEGLGFFPNLRVLNLSGSALVYADLADCPSLEEVIASNCPNLSQMTLGEKPLLRVLEAAYCSLADIDLSGAPALQAASLSGNPLVALAVTGNPNLTDLSVLETPLQSLDLQANTLLVNLSCEDSVVLENLDATPLHAYWVPVEYKESTDYQDSDDDSEYWVQADIDDRGNVLELYYSNDEDSSYFTYDDNNNCITAQVGSRDYELKYDERGRLTEATPKGDDTVYTCSYDAKGCLVQCREGSKSSGRTVYQYDLSYTDAGALEKIRDTTSYSGEPPYVSEWSLSYDAAGKLTSINQTKSEWDDPDNLVKYAYAYDDAGHLVSMAQTSDYSYGEETALAYDNDGKLASLELFPKNTTGYWWEYDSSDFTYNANGLATGWTQRYYENQECEYVREVTITYERVLTVCAKQPSWSMVRTNMATTPSRVTAPFPLASGINVYDFARLGIPEVCKPVS